MPRKTCAVFCDACIHGVTAALVSPRQLTPLMNPSGSAGVAGFTSFLTNWSYGRFDLSAVTSQGVMLLRPAVSEKYVTPSSLRRRSFHKEIQCAAYLSLSASRVLTSAARFAGFRSARKDCSSAGEGGSPQVSR